MPKRDRATGRLEKGTFFLMPHHVLKHPYFATLSPRATKLFLDLASQFNGRNNGDLAAAWGLMKDRGWRSRDQLFKAQSELIEKGFILKTRQGGKNHCNLFALTFLPIDECDGKLEVPATLVPSNDWKEVTIKKSVTRNEDRAHPLRVVN